MTTLKVCGSKFDLWLRKRENLHHKKKFNSFKWIIFYRTMERRISDEILTSQIYCRKIETLWRKTLQWVLGHQTLAWVMSDIIKIWYFAWIVRENPRFHYRIFSKSKSILQSNQKLSFLPPFCSLTNRKMFILFLAAAWCATVLPFPSLTAKRVLSNWYKRINSSKFPASAAWIKLF